MFMSYNIYVIELDESVKSNPSFQRKNPDMNYELVCFYVGSSWYSPEERFEQHKRGYKSSRWVRNYGIRLRPDIYEEYMPFDRSDYAKNAESLLALYLRLKGHGVAQA